ncbi:hypothetical protein [Clostridium guangxiense]|uniref:hypothetical protein n=1 Tax=Clostridium guangxiense TaxID=1662055 RepID=UPI001E513C0C|nr:hypothetical protein [Clostridium guangxiense]MCD2348260.1 hypothetical protein [Clostridium guangxiense]
MGASELEYSASIISQCSSNIKSEKNNFSSRVSGINLDNRDEENNITLQAFNVVNVEISALTSLMDRIAEQLREEARRLRQEEEEARQREKQHDEAGASA